MIDELWLMASKKDERVVIVDWLRLMASKTDDWAVIVN
jgi:hypothetical protein